MGVEEREGDLKTMLVDVDFAVGVFGGFAWGIVVASEVGGDDAKEDERYFRSSTGRCSR